MCNDMLSTTTDGKGKEQMDGAMRISFLTLKKRKPIDLVDMSTEEGMDLFMYLMEVAGILSITPGFWQANKQATPLL